MLKLIVLKISRFAIVFILLTVVAVVGYLLYRQNKLANINSYKECVAAGYPIMESYPERCMTPDGHSFVNEEAVFCTMDAKVCPDGSSVGRVPPDCAFAPCPGE